MIKTSNHLSYMLLLISLQSRCKRTEHKSLNKSPLNPLCHAWFICPFSYNQQHNLVLDLLAILTPCLASIDRDRDISMRCSTDLSEVFHFQS